MQKLVLCEEGYIFVDTTSVHTPSLLRIGKRKKKKNLQDDGRAPRRVYVDVDGTLFDFEFRSLDDLGEPNLDVIETIREMKADGDLIVIWSARTNSNLNPDIPKEDLIRRLAIQLEMHGVPFDEIEITDKPHFDLLIDDKVMNASRFMRPPNEALSPQN